MKTYIKYFVLTFLFLFLTHSPVVALYNENSYNISYPQPSRIIVKYRDGFNPHDLNKKIKELQKNTVTPTGFLLQQLDIFSKKFRGELTVQEMVAQQLQVGKITNTISTTPLFSPPTKINRSDDYYVIEVTPLKPLDEIINDYKKLSQVEWVIPDAIVSTQTTSIKNTNKGETPQSKLSQDQVTIALLDTGVNKTDQNGHGSLVSSIITNQSSKAKQITHSTNTISILPLKVLDTQGYGHTSTVMKALQYVIDHAATDNIRIVNLSLASPRFSTDKSLYDGCNIYNDVLSPRDINKKYIKDIYGQEMVIVAAAGNDNQELSGKDQSYDGVAPASCNGIVSVGASDNKKKASFSNYGNLSLFAPGVQGKNKGTSLAAAYVSGSFAQLFVKGSLGVSSTEKKDIDTTKEDALLKELEIIPNAQPTPTAKPNTQNSFSPTNAVSQTNTQSPTKTPSPASNFPTGVSPTISINNSPTPIPTMQPTSKPTRVPTSQPSPTHVPPPTATAVPAPTATPIPPSPTSAPPPPAGPSCSNTCAEDAQLCPRDTIPSGECPSGRGIYCVCETNL